MLMEQQNINAENVRARSISICFIVNVFLAAIIVQFHGQLSACLLMSCSHFVECE